MKEKILLVLNNTVGTSGLEQDIKDILVESIMTELLPPHADVEKKPFIDKEYTDALVKREIAERLNGQYDIDSMILLFNEMFRSYHKEDISYSKVGEIVRGLILNVPGATPQVYSGKRETPVAISGAGHVFRRYLFENKFAEEMKCMCGYVIWPCWSEQEVESAIKSISGELKKCPKAKS